MVKNSPNNRHINILIITDNKAVTCSSNVLLE